MSPRPALVALLFLLACSGPEVVPTQYADGKRAVVSIGERNVVTVEPPAGAAIADNQTWALVLDASHTIVLRVHRAPEPEGGADKYVDSLLAALGKSGQADVETDERVKLGDLDARLIHAVELRNTPVMGLWMLLVVAEDGLYTATAYGERADLSAHGKDLRHFLLSLRIDNRDSTPVRQSKPVPGDDVEPPAELTRTK